MGESLPVMPEKGAVDDLHEIAFQKEAAHLFQFFPVPVSRYKGKGSLLSVLFHEMGRNFTGIGDDIIRGHAHGGGDPLHVTGGGKS